MSDDRFLEHLRGDARLLRFEPDEHMITRIAARIRTRIRSPQPTAAQFLARWARPLTATLSAIALASSIGVVLLERAMSEQPSIDSLSASNAIEISAAGEIYSVGD